MPGGKQLWSICQSCSKSPARKGRMMNDVVAPGELTANQVTPRHIISHRACGAKKEGRRGPSNTHASCESLRGAAVFPRCLRKKLDHVAVKFRDIGGLAAADPVAIANANVVNPVRAGILQIVLNGLVARNLMSPHQSG